jgi:transketolase
LSRQNLPQLEGSTIEKALKGGYVLQQEENPDLIIVSTGSEVYIARDAAALLKKEGIMATVVSLPDWHTFDQQDKEYKLSVFPDGVPVLSAEVMATTGWQKYAHEQFGINRFGASGPYKDVYNFFEFTPEGIAKRARATVEFYKGHKVRSQLNRAFV